MADHVATSKRSSSVRLGAPFIISLVRCLCHAQKDPTGPKDPRFLGSNQIFRKFRPSVPGEVVGYRAERHSLDGSLIRRVSVLYPIHIPLFTSFYTSHWCRCSTTLPFILVRNNAGVACHGRFIRNLQAIVPWHTTFSLNGG